MPSYFDLNPQKGYDQVIENSVEARRAPIEEKEEQKKTLDYKIEQLQTLKTELATLDNFTDQLAGFNSSFREKVFKSENEAILEGQAERLAEISEHEINIHQIAKAHSFSSRAIDREEELPAGELSFRSGEEEVRMKFRGGTLRSLHRSLRNSKDISEMFDVSLVPKNRDELVLVFKTKATGVSSRVEYLSDLKEPLNEAIQLFGDAKEKKTIKFYDGKTYSKTDGAQVFEDEKRYQLNPLSRIDSRSSLAREIQNQESLSFELQWQNIVQESLSNETSEMGSFELSFEEELSHEELSLKIPQFETYLDANPEEAVEPVEPVVDPMVGLLTFSGDGKTWTYDIELDPDFSERENGSKRIRLTSAQLKSPVNAQNLQLESFSFFNNNEEYIINVLDFKIESSAKEMKDGEFKTRAVHALSDPQNSLFNYQGIEVEREANVVEDLMPGVRLELKAAGKGPVAFDIDRDYDAVKEDVINLVGQYNLIMEHLNAGLNRAPPPDDVDESKEKLYGLYLGERSLEYLRNQLKLSMTDAYNISIPGQRAMMIEFGFESVFSLGNPNDINAGKLDFNEETYDEAVAANFVKARDLFAFDSDGDRLMDSGVAVKIGNIAGEFSRRGSVIDIQIDASRRQIDRLDDEIEDDEEDVEDYRQELVKEFTEVEQAQQEFERMKDWLDNSTGN